MRYFYWYLYLLLWLFAFIAPNVSDKAQKRLLAWYCAIWTIVFGFRRYDVGNDTPGYAAFFENAGIGQSYGTIDSPDETLESGFLLFSQLVNFFTDSATIVFFLIGVGVWSGSYLLFNKQSSTPLLAFLMMMTITGKMFYTLGIAVRQAVSIVVILFGIILIIKSGIDSWRHVYKNKWAIWGVLLCLGSITIHRTTGAMTMILIILYFFRLSKIGAYFLIIAFTGIAVWAAPMIGQMFDSALLVVGAFSDEKVNLLGDRYMGDMTSYGYSGGAMIAWTVPALLTTYLSNKQDVNSFFFKIYIFSLCLHQFIQFSTMHIRLTPLFILLGFISAVPAICAKNRFWYNVYLVIGLFYLYLDYIMFKQWDIAMDAAVPYYFIWE